MNNAAPTQESAIKYYGNRDSIGYWGAMVASFGVISVGASLAGHSLILTSGLLVGAVAVWWLGYWTLRKSCYFISPTKIGFKDIFRTREVEIDEIRSVTHDTGRYSSTLIFVCNARTVSIPFDPFDESWFTAVKSELEKRGITVSAAIFGFKVKGE
jgi:hypothetical protein